METSAERKERFDNNLCSSIFGAQYRAKHRAKCDFCSEFTAPASICRWPCTTVMDPLTRPVAIVAPFNDQADEVSFVKMAFDIYGPNGANNFAQTVYSTKLPLVLVTVTDFVLLDLVVMHQEDSNPDAAWKKCPDRVWLLKCGRNSAKILIPQKWKDTIPLIIELNRRRKFNRTRLM